MKEIGQGLIKPAPRWGEQASLKDPPVQPAQQLIPWVCFNWMNFRSSSPSLLSHRAGAFCTPAGLGE